MRYSSLPQLEASFRTSGNGGQYALRPIAVPVKGEQLTLKAMLVTPANRSGYFHAAVHPKRRIVLHYTVGNTRSDIQTLTGANRRVSVPFVIARDGTIYQLFSSRFWSGHIGRTPLNANNAEDMATIGIELSNYGFLVPREGNLETCYSRVLDPRTGQTGPVDVYCSRSETGAYHKLATPFRDQAYYASYTPEQYDSLVVLLRYLTAQYGIPRRFLPESKRYLTTPDVLNFPGIVSHVNYRESGKWDIGPAFDWQRVIAGVEAPVFMPAASREPETAVSMEVINDEATIEQLLPSPSDAPEEVLDDDAGLLAEKLALEAAAAEKPNLYALIVGIDAYPREVVLEGRVSFPPLRGCVADAHKVWAYLNAETHFQKHIKVLTNESATKDAIVAAFRNHLSKAGEGDTVVFYYSGHGTQELADAAVWTGDKDGRLECLACYYDRHNAGGFLLADKELRFLINEVAQRKPHIVTLFDCCHSGDNTRNAGFVQAAFEGAVEKRVPFAFQQRSWVEFIFSDQLDRDTVTEIGETAALPEGAHVQLSACEMDESAMEVNGEGVFTKTLLQVLAASGGQVAYGELRSRVRQYLRNVFEQKPRIYAAGDPNLLYAPFLNLPVKTGVTLSEVVFNPEGRWLLNLGAIHGIDRNSKVVIINGEERIGAAVRSVQVDHAELELPAGLEQGKAYKAEVAGLLSAALPIHVANTDGTLEDQDRLLREVLDGNRAYVRPADRETGAAYVVHHRHGQLYLAAPGDPWRPLAEPVGMERFDATQRLGHMLRHVSQWTFLKQLENRDASTRLPQQAIRLEVEQVRADGSRQPLHQQDHTCTIGFEEQDGRRQMGLRIRLTNTSGQSLYCAVLYLTSQFASFTGLLNPATYLLPAGATVDLQLAGEPVLPVEMDELYQWYNWPSWSDHLKVIYSSQEFDAAALSLDALPMAPVPGNRGGVQEKSIAINHGEKRVELDGWGTHMLTLRYLNPEFNTISEENLAQFVQDEELAEFALGIYFEAQVVGMETRYKLRPEIKVEKEKDLLQRGFVGDRVIDLANWWARGRRNRHYRQMARRFPSRPIMVSEGDSWFQHPLVVDTIDHLSRTYPIYCVAAAGDTLRNYVSGAKRRGEYFLDAIEQEDPVYFLLSGGGNDILGEQFRSYLLPYPNDGIPEGEQPQRLVKQSLFDELASLREIYRTLFGDLAVNKPKLKILVHGYDYPIKLDSPDKGWLGRYMIEKGIPAADRRAIIRMIMDAFNKMLEELAAEFPQVSYIDVRNVVRYDPVNGPDQWYDEIHPNNDGYQQVAMRFMQRIQQLSPLVREPQVLHPPASPLPELSKAPEPLPAPSRGGDLLASLDKALTNADLKPRPVGSSPGAGPFDSTGPKEAEPASPPAASGFTQGQMDYDIPGVMEVGKTVKCRVRIGDQNVAAALVEFEGSEGVHVIRITDEMSVRLIDPSGGAHFNVVALNNERQAMFPGDVTSWSFQVTPLKGGAFPLALRISVHLGARSRDLDIMEKEVMVRASAGAAPEAEPPRRILFLAANPYDTRRLSLGIESREVQEALQTMTHREIVFTMNMAVTTRTLMRNIIREKPSIIHFSGHGELEGLCFETEDGATRQVDEVTLAALFSQFDDHVSCVVLNACYSEGQARAIARHIPYVVGMNAAIRDKAALAFSIGFYTAIAGGKTIPEAYELGLVHMQLEGEGRQGHVPVLIERSQVAQPEA